MFKLVLFLLLVIHPSVYAKDFVLFTQPKTGTHLLIPILTELTKKYCYWGPEYTRIAGPLAESYEEASQNPNNFLFSLDRHPWSRQMMDMVWNKNQHQNTFLHLHAPYSHVMENYLSEKNCVNFFVRRDPRDQIVSLLNHYKNIHFNDPVVELIPTDEDRLLYMIRKESKAHTTHFMKWANSPVCCVLDFEKLMGAHGESATDADALDEMRKIAAALELNLSDQKLKKIYIKHFGHGWNFFKGKTGVWKKYFNEAHKAAIKEEIGDLLIQLGYEKDLNW